MDIQNWVKPEVINQPAYRVKTVDFEIKMNQNESPWDLPQTLKAEISDKIQNTDWNHYPDLISTKLKKKIAKLNGLKDDQIIVGKGSNEIFQAIFTATLSKGEEVCLLSPTFAVYQILAEHLEAKVINSTLNKSFEIDENDLLEKSKDAKLTILCNPNSPTGNLIKRDLIESILQETRGLVIIDEAYYEFSGLTCSSLIDSYPNLLITRTFSKVFGLAAFRLGYGMMPTEFSNQIQKCMLPFNIDVPCAIAGELVLDHLDLFKSRADLIVMERDRMIKSINAIDGFLAQDSTANYFLMSGKIPPKELFTKIGSSGILIRDVSSYPGCDNYVRVSVGLPEENLELLKVLESLK